MQIHKRYHVNQVSQPEIYITAQHSTTNWGKAASHLISSNTQIIIKEINRATVTQLHKIIILYAYRH